MNKTHSSRSSPQGTPRINNSSSPQQQKHATTQQQLVDFKSKAKQDECATIHTSRINSISEASNESCYTINMEKPTITCINPLPHTQPSMDKLQLCQKKPHFIVLYSLEMCNCQDTPILFLTTSFLSQRKWGPLVFFFIFFVAPYKRKDRKVTGVFYHFLPSAL